MVHVLLFNNSMQAIQNLGLAVIALIAGIIVDSKGYLILEVFFMAWLCCKYLCSQHQDFWHYHFTLKISEAAQQIKMIAFCKSCHF